MSDIRLPRGTEKEQVALALRSGLIQAAPYLEPLLNQYEELLQTERAESLLQQETEIIRQLLKQDNQLLARAGTYGAVLGHINDSLATIQNELVAEVETLKNQMGFILEAFAGLEHVDVYRHQPNLDMKHESERVLEFVKQTKRIIALAENGQEKRGV